jgi:hypothetical protein
MIQDAGFMMQAKKKEMREHGHLVRNAKIHTGNTIHDNTF